MPKYYAEISKTAKFSASAIFAMLDDLKNISDVTKMQQQCDARY